MKIAISYKTTTVFFMHCMTFELSVVSVKLNSEYLIVKQHITFYPFTALMQVGL
jgi:hypothetical protein